MTGDAAKRRAVCRDVGEDGDCGGREWACKC